MHIGITGHQRLDSPEAWEWVSDVIDIELKRAAPPLIGVTSLAVGADQLLARLVLEMGGAVIAILPYADIEKSFAPDDVPAFRKLLSHAKAEVMDTEGTEEDAYLAAGHRVAAMSDLLLAVWDGQPAKGKGGTADIVDYSLKHNVPLIHINPVTRRVRRVNTPT